MRYLAILFVTAALASSASALTMEIIYLTGETDQPADTVCNQLWFDTEGVDWLSGQIVVQPTDGDVYQDAMGSEQSPAPAWVSMVPSLGFDSYISNGAPGEACSVVDPVDLTSDDKVWDNVEAKMGWYTSDTDDIGNLKLAQITLDNTCQGGWKIRVTAYPPETGPMIQELDLLIEDGHLLPEPATMGLLAIGGLGMLIRRKR